MQGAEGQIVKINRRARKNRGKPYIPYEGVELENCAFRWIDDGEKIEIICDDVPGFDNGKSTYDYRIAVSAGEAVEILKVALLRNRPNA